MAENPKKSSLSLELKIQIPRHWRDALDAIAEKGFEHRSANDVALSFIGAGIRTALGGTTVGETREAIRRLEFDVIRGRHHERSDLEEPE